MRKLNQKGLSLIEVITTIAIMAILLTIAIPSIHSIIKKTRQQYYSTLEDQVKLAGMDYYADYREERPTFNLATKQVELKILIDQNYFKKEVKDVDGNDSCTNNSYVRILKQSEGKYEYVACLVCSDYKSSHAYCDNDYDPNHAIYTLEAPELVKSYINQPIDVNRLDKAVLKARGKEIAKVTASYESISGIDVTQKQLYKDQVLYQVSLEDGTIQKTQTTDLQIYQNAAPTVTLKQAATTSETDKNYKEKYSSNTWTNRNVQETLEVKEKYPDEFDQIQRYDESKDTWITYCTSTECSRDHQVKIGNTFEDQVTVRGIDKKGNVSETGTYSIKIDKIAPVCPTIKVVSANKGYPVELEIPTMTDVNSWTWNTNNNNKTGGSATWSVGSTFNTGQGAKVKIEGEGTRQGKVIIKDVAGNQSECLTSIYTINYCDSTKQETGSWGNCSKTCGGGTRSRTITTKANYNGKTCSTKTENEPCNTNACTPTVKLQGNIDKWQCGKCRKSCDGYAGKVNGTCPSETYGNTIGHVSGTVSNNVATFKWEIAQGSATYIGKGYWVRFIIKDSAGTVMLSQDLKASSAAQWGGGSYHSGTISYTFTKKGTYYIYIDGNSDNPKFDMNFGTIVVS